MQLHEHERNGHVLAPCLRHTCDTPMRHLLHLLHLLHLRHTQLSAGMVQWCRLGQALNARGRRQPARPRPLLLFAV